MSTYDAYQLSIRDSTEFTVPTGGSGSSGRLDIFKIKIRIDPGNSSPEVGSNFSFPTIVGANEEYNVFNLPYVEFMNPGVSISHDNEQHEIEVVAVDGNAIFMMIKDPETGGDDSSIKSTSDTISVQDNDGFQYFIASGDGSIDFIVGSESAVEGNLFNS